MGPTVAAAIDYTQLTAGLTGAFENGVELALPVVGIVIASGLVIRTIRRFAK